jgi:amphi-Trp domain-containing protein
MSRRLNFTTRLTRDDVAGIMEAMMEGMREGLLKVQKSDETLEMVVPRVIDFDVRAAVDKDRARCALEISWRPNREENPDVPDADRERFVETREASAGDYARASLREAARAAREAAKTAGLVLEKTARAASGLVRKGLDGGKAGEGEQDAEGILSQMGAKVEAVARRARKAARGIVAKTRKDGESCALQGDVAAPDSSLSAPPVPAASEPDSAPSLPDSPAIAASEPDSAPSLPAPPGTAASEPDSAPSLPDSPAIAVSEPDSAPSLPAPPGTAASLPDSAPQTTAEGAALAPARKKTAAPSRAKTPAPKTRSGSPGTKKAGSGKAKLEE